jgi:hypothetical protein
MKMAMTDFNEVYNFVKKLEILQHTKLLAEQDDSKEMTVRKVHIGSNSVKRKRDGCKVFLLRKGNLIVGGRVQHFVCFEKNSRGHKHKMSNKMQR